MRRKLLVGLLAASLLAACGGNVKAPVSGRTRYDGPPLSYYTVRKGDTLYAIAWHYGLDYKSVAARNGIRSPYVIHPGQRLRLRPMPRGQSRGASPYRPATTSRAESGAARSRSKGGSGTVKSRSGGANSVRNPGLMPLRG